MKMVDINSKFNKWLKAYGPRSEYDHVDNIEYIITDIMEYVLMDDTLVGFDIEDYDNFCYYETIRKFVK